MEFVEIWSGFWRVLSVLYAPRYPHGESQIIFSLVLTLCTLHQSDLSATTLKHFLNLTNSDHDFQPNPDTVNSHLNHDNHHIDNSILH